MGAQQTYQSGGGPGNLMTQISDDIGNGFEEDMLDMQGRIGSYRSL